ncbi:hypothetical protein NDU88_003213 [Pleurodeles waltl]|uniref:Uncharacterized protein n=1 Tax=Pleurodeles waltl TaxID=8319 RepID=A0AAV7PCA7_PLEWA|nr:hypothetical protein NDU88_003213 [Pleurodeles waltl]
MDTGARGPELKLELTGARFGDLKVGHKLTLVHAPEMPVSEVEPFREKWQQHTVASHAGDRGKEQVLGTGALGS